MSSTVRLVLKFATRHKSLLYCISSFCLQRTKDTDTKCAIIIVETSKMREINVVSIEPESQSTELQDAFGRLAEAALPDPFSSQVGS